jgi:hypothetical protein
MFYNGPWQKNGIVSRDVIGRYENRATLWDIVIALDN